MSCEGDLTASDLDASVSNLTLSRNTAGSSVSVNLYQYIHHAHCEVANGAPGSSSTTTTSSSLPALVLRPHDTRHATDAEGSVLTDDAESGLLVNVVFSELVRIKQLLLTVPTGDERIDRCRVWVNRIDVPSIDDIENDAFVKPDQDFSLLEGERECVEYPVRVARFSSVSSVTVFLSSLRPATQRVFYLGFKGDPRSYKKEGGDNISVAAQNTADSVVQGLREKYGAAQQSIR